MSAPSRILTLAGAGADELVVRKSRFISRAAPVASEDEALNFIREVRGSDKAASHHCYAYILGAQGEGARFSDDGEPQGTAGLPILNALRNPGLTNCACVVTRHFGGTLLGAPGLTRAYANAAGLAVRAAGTAVWEESRTLSAKIPYDRWDRARHAILRAGAEIMETEFTDAVRFMAVIRASGAGEMHTQIAALTDGLAKLEISKPFYKPWPADGAAT